MEIEEKLDIEFEKIKSILEDMKVVIKYHDKRLDKLEEKEHHKSKRK